MGVGVVQSGWLLWRGYLEEEGSLGLLHGLPGWVSNHAISSSTRIRTHSGLSGSQDTINVGFRQLYYHRSYSEQKRKKNYCPATLPFVTIPHLG